MWIKSDYLIVKFLYICWFSILVLSIIERNIEMSAIIIHLFSWLIHGIACLRISFLFKKKAEWYFIVCMCLSIHLLIDIWFVVGGSDGVESACSAGDLDLIPGSGRSPEEGIQYSCLENSMDRGAKVHGVTKNWTQLSD